MLRRERYLQIWKEEAIFRGIYTTWSFMTHIDIKHSVSAQERLEWVAPKILLMKAIDTSGKASASVESTTLKGDFLRGPS